MRWGMVINLTRCVGCYACVLACKTEHFLPPDVVWNRVTVFEAEELNKQIYPTLCNHCRDPYCVEVCPTGATQQREDGIVWVDPDICIGCRSCVMNCPYQVRVVNEKPKEYFPGQGLTKLAVCLGAVQQDQLPGQIDQHHPDIIDQRQQ